MIFKKTLFKKNILAVIPLLISYTSYSGLTASTSLTPAQLLQTALLGSGVTAINITYNGVSFGFVILSRLRDLFIDHRKIICYELQQ